MRNGIDTDCAGISVELSLSRELIDRLRKLVGIEDTKSLVRVAIKMGICYLDKMQSANVTLGTGGMYDLPDECENAESVNDSDRVSVNDLAEKPPFSKEQMIRQFHTFNLYGIRSITKQEADAFWEYLVMTNFRNAGGIRVNLSTVGGVLRHWRQYNANKVREAQARQRKAEGSETESERSERIKRSLQEDPDDCL